MRPRAAKVSPGAPNEPSSRWRSTTRPHRRSASRRNSSSPSCAPVSSMASSSSGACMPPPSGPPNHALCSPASGKTDAQRESRPPRRAKRRSRVAPCAETAPTGSGAKRPGASGARAKKVRVNIKISSDIKILKETAGKIRGGKKPTYSLTPRAPCVNSGKRAND